MSTTTPVPTVPKVRTFAADLTATRALRGMPAVPSPLNLQTAKPTISAPKKIPKTTVVVAKKNTPPVQPAKKIILPPAKIVPAAVRAPATPTPKTVPPFHTFQKPHPTPNPGTHTAIDTSDFVAAQKTDRPSVLANPGIEGLVVARGTPAETGTVITDTKHDRTSLISALVTSLTSWWGTKKAAERKQPKYMVPEADRRRGVIQKATTKTGRTETADHQATLMRIKAAKKTTRRNIPTQLPPTTTTVLPTTQTQSDWATLDEPKNVEIPELAHAQFEGILDDEISTTPPQQEVPVAVVPVVEPPVSRPRITPIIPTIVETEVPLQTPTELRELPVSIPVIAEEPTVLSTTPTNQSAPERETATLTPPLITPLERPRIVPKIPSMPVESIPSVAVVPTVESIALPTVPHWGQSIAKPNTTRSKRTFAPSKSTAWSWQTIFQHTNYLALGVAGTGAIVGILWFSIGAFSSGPTISTESESSPTLFENSITTTPTATIFTKEQLVLVLEQAKTEAESLVEVTLMSPTTGLPFSASELFILLDATVPTDFVEAINRVVVGNYRNEPWLAFYTSDTTTVRGGMLDWEKTVSSNLAPWFGEPVTRSAQSGITLFHDSVVAGVDVRILTDTTGTERITYGFISPNQLLITSNTTAFLNLVEKVAAR